LFYLTTKHVFENFGRGNCPVAIPLVAGLLILPVLQEHPYPLKSVQTSYKNVSKKYVDQKFVLEEELMMPTS